ncbi:hypothetical protein [Actinomycetospora sp.]|uniref:hypothetical protein n=1 Tax=Actinomycetospora sp. TaxID=1872135 RepID=UPI002F41C669
MTAPRVAFETTAPFGFFDYFRVPHRTGAALPAGVVPLPGAGCLWSATDSPVLTWARPERRPARERLTGRFDLDGVPLAGHVLRDEVIDRELADRGGWQPAEAVTGADGTRCSSVWRHPDGSVLLPFDPGEVMTTLWSERYLTLGRSPLPAALRALAIRGYYLVRPALPRPVQLRLRQAFTKVQGRAEFPRWPVEDGLADLYGWLFARLEEIAGAPVPWLDLWPDGRDWAFVLTHDVETRVGFDGRELLRGPERDLGLRSSWNLVAERYEVDDDVVRALQDEGCEIGVHGLRHDGKDLGSRRLLRRRLPAMRRAAQRWGARGFRSPATQRRWEWMPTLGFDYDTSTPDTDPYEPQPGGCATTLPFLHGEMVELPITLPQDHTVFAILDEPDGGLWLEKTGHIRDRRGMALVLTHPDYAVDPRVVAAYSTLLATHRDDPTAWHALPGEVATWWHRRAHSELAPAADGWEVVGPAAGRGRVRLGSHPAADPITLAD